MRLISVNSKGLKSLNGEYSIAPLTILTGPNGTGKTSILQSIVFALLGNIPSLGKSADKLAPLMAGDELSVRLTGDNGKQKVSVTRGLVRKGERISQTLRVTPSGGEEKLAQVEARVAHEFGSFPVMFSLDDFIGLSADKRRAFLFQLAAAAGTLGPDQVRGMAEALLDPETEAAALPVAKAYLIQFEKAAVDEGCSTAHEVIDRMLAALKAEESAVAAHRKHRHGSVQSLTEALAGLTAAVGDAASLREEAGALNGQVEAAARELEQARAALADFQRARGRLQDIAKLRAGHGEDPAGRLVEARAAVEEKRREADALAGEAAQLQQQETAALAAAKDLQTEATAAAVDLARAQAEAKVAQEMLAKLGTCPKEDDPACCLRMRRAELVAQTDAIVPLESACAAADEVSTAKVAEAGGLRRQLTEALEKQRKVRMEAEALAGQAADAEKAATSRGAHLQALADEEARLQPLIQTPPAVDLEVLQARLDGLRQRRDDAQRRLEAVARRETTERTLAQDRAALAEDDAKGEALKAVKAALGPKGLQGDVARQVLEPLTEAANRVLAGLPAGKRFAVRTVNDRGAEALDLGWEREGALIHFETLSTGERLQFAAALAAGLLALKPLPLRVLLVDDLQSVDEANRGPFVRALHDLIGGGYVDNVLCASVVPVDVGDLPWGVCHEMGKA